MNYAPTLDSIQQHAVPPWFHDAKLGIFIHWGLYSVPGWAPTTGPLPEVVANEGWDGWFRRNPYAEWYMNSIRVPDSVSAAYHAEHYGAHTAYADFAPQFNDAAQAWNPDDWAALFAAAGARYVVLTTKHHDGFLLWPSRQPNPFITEYHAQRDLVGELTDAVRAHDMTMGLYYSGGLDWTFNDHVIADIADLFAAVPQGNDYADYATAHWRELIERYAPAVLWNDIGYPSAANLPALFAEYYNHITGGVVNDRFIQVDPSKLSGDPARLMEDGLPQAAHWDFRTPEYAMFDEIKPEKWESCRGLGYSFGYNRNENVTDMLSPSELIRSFVDIVSKNGNLLLNVGPMADGTIPAEQRERLLALGDWLQINGEAIYGIRPWQRAEGRTTDGIPVRFTQKDDALYATLLDTPRSSEIVVEDLAPAAGALITLLGHDGVLHWTQQDAHLVITVPQPFPNAAAHVFRVR